MGRRLGARATRRPVRCVVCVCVGRRDLPIGHVAGSGPAHERGIELVDLAGGVLQRSGHVLAHGLGVTRGAALTGTSLLLALLGAFTIAGHDSGR